MEQINGPIIPFIIKVCLSILILYRHDIYVFTVTRIYCNFVCFPVYEFNGRLKNNIT